MKVVLLQHVTGLGQKGDVKEVSTGYFQNFLKKRNLAQEASESVLRHVNNQKAKSEERLQNFKESAEALKAKIEGKTIILKEKVSDSGTLYASVTAKEVSEALKEQHKALLPANSLRLPSHIKELGQYEVTAVLYKEITANFTLHVISA